MPGRLQGWVRSRCQKTGGCQFRGKDSGPMLLPAARALGAVTVSVITITVPGPAGAARIWLRPGGPVMLA